MNTRTIKRTIVILTIASLPVLAMVSVVSAATYYNPLYLTPMLTSLCAMYGIVLLDRKGSAMLKRLTY